MKPIDLSRLVVTGGAGLVGRVVPFGSKLAHTDLDVRDRAQVFKVIRALQGSAILHLAGLDLRYCQTNPLEAYKTNVLGTYHLACMARELNIPMILVSTGAIFNGPTDTVFDEQAMPDPLNIYGQTKYLAEVILTETWQNSLIIRTGWLFGGSLRSHKKFVDVAIDLARQGEPIFVSAAQQGSPTYVNDFVGEMQRLILGQQRGIVHVVNGGIATAYDIAREIVVATHSVSSIQLREPSQLSSLKIPRSPSEALTSNIVRLRLWTEALRDYLQTKNTF
jgi:dTDP-4-dehydrorhamnose reductase